MKALGLDMDGVLYGWHEAVYEYLRLYRDYKGTFKELWSVDFKKFTEEDWEFLINIDILYTSRMPTPDCIKFLDYVKDKFELYYITARPKYVKTTTEQYLRHYNFPSQDNLIFESDKVNTVRRLKIDYFIDDLPKHLEGLSKVCDVIMIERPYNEKERELYKSSQTLLGTIKYLED